MSENNNNSFGDLLGETLVKYNLHEKSLSLIFVNKTFLLLDFPEIIIQDSNYNVESKEYFKTLESFYDKKIKSVQMRTSDMKVDLIFENERIIRCPLSDTIIENRN